ncbi:MAG TPA: hypothetical protein VHQ45_06835 [Gemmatimonadaceae bacterium]|nr:hypothetical protein [Gemmatimonadaceae bacterium]
MSRLTTRRPGALLAACLLPLLIAAWPTAATAQYLTRPERAWRSLSTAHFDVFFPAEMEEWTRDVASRLDAVHAGVDALVGFAPRQRITVLVEDPLNVSNGFALPFRDQPTIFLWPTPPDPTSLIANNRGWGELLAVHEYAHIAHLVRPSRNARQRLIWRLLPVDVGPIARRAPRWVTEGYATVIEGQLTGSGRPSSAGRAAVLRARALEGQLPTYAQLDASGTFQGGAMAYLAGSAFLEWLQAARGDSSLVSLWRRMTARQDRGFAAAFTGVYGASPDELYGRFSAELTGQALEAERRLRSEGLSTGRLVQHRGWSSGDPAVSADGALLALALRSRDLPSRVVVWRTSDSAETAAARRARERLMQRDPDDVPAVLERPLPKAAIATLHAVNGAAYEYPRFLPDGRQLLVSRSVPVGDGTARPDLFVWDRESGHVRRLTYGAGIRWADPSPDGRQAAAVRCTAGVCDLVRVDLASGAVTLLSAGSPAVAWFRPRWSPGGREIVASVQSAGRWRLAVVPADGGAPRMIGDGEWSRYGADWAPDGRSVVATSERGGIPHLARVDAATGAERPLTRTTGASLASDVGHDGTTYFLELHARGHDVREVHADSVLAPGAPALLAALTPAVPPLAPPSADSFATATLPPSELYGWGPRRWRVLPGASASPEGWTVSLMAANLDPIARFTWLAQAGLGEPGAWRGGALSAAWRGLAPTLSAEAFWTEQRPSTLRDGDVVPTSLDAVYAGVHAFADASRSYARTSWRAAAGASAGSVDPDAEGAERVGRVLGYGEVGGSFLVSGDRWSVGGALSPQLATGRTGADQWTRARVGSSAAVRVAGVRVAASGTYAEVGRDAPAYEQIAVGGMAPPFFDERLLGQRLAMPVLPPGTLGGRRAGTLRLALPVLGAEAYYWLGSAGDRLERWHRVVGAEYGERFPAIGFVRLPQTAVRAGAGYSLDEPFRHRLRGYLSVVYRP